MIAVKEAINASMEFLRDLERNSYGVRVEEVEESSNEDWLITLGFYEDTFLAKFTLKIFTVDGQTGDVRSMKNHPSP